MSAGLVLRRLADETASDDAVIRILVEAIEDAERGIITMAELVEIAQAAT